jgi:diguanylate cyclase (GGDEF)-like protein
MLTLRRLPAAWRVWSFSAALGIAAAVLWAGLLRGAAVPAPPVHVPWILMAVGFFAAEAKVMDVHFRREKHSFSLSEVPTVVGFFILSPSDYILAMLTGVGLALLLDRQRPVKVAFNLADSAFLGLVAMTIFVLVRGPDGLPGPRDWLGAFAATGAAAVLSSFTIATVITLSGGAPQFQKLPEMIQFGGLVAIANTSLALLAVAALWMDPLLLVLLVVPLVTLVLAYRAYLSEREKHERLELLYQSSRILQHSPELDSALAALLEHAREMFRAERAEILLHSQDDGDEGLLTAVRHDGQPITMQPTLISEAHPIHHEVARATRAQLFVGVVRDASGIRNAMAVPLPGESRLVGTMLVANRLTEGTTFGDDDLRLLETLANQAAVALENGQLEQSLAELSRLKEELRHLAYHDPLTGLANRTLFIDRVEEVLVGGEAKSQLPVVLFLDLDNFKDVNDTLGHAAGDRMLVAVAERVRACIRGDDLAARLGGDEFAVLLFDDERLGHSLAVATRILEAFRVSFPVEGQDLKMSASIGIAAGEHRVEHANELLRNADVAMYTAKQAGKNRFSVFEPGMHAAIVARHTMSTELSRGIADGEIEVHYQPVLGIATGLPYGAEALARWRHPQRGIMGPDEFIPLAEESGAILELGRAVLFQACRDAATWHSPTGTPLSVAVNLSSAQLADDGFVADLADILRATGLPATRLVLEMTETVMFHDTQTTIERLRAVREMGAKVAIDDFGTGYSSLGYLRRFPVDILKIAREFVAPASAGLDEWAFASAIIGLGRTLGLRIVAEGIEEPAQLLHLRRLGCELGQGYLFARPMPAPDIARHFATAAEPASATITADVAPATALSAAIA